MRLPVELMCAVRNAEIEREPSLAGAVSQMSLTCNRIAHVHGLLRDLIAPHSSQFISLNLAQHISHQ